MGGKELTLRPDSRLYDLDYHFPDVEGDVGVSLSSGIESTILLHILCEIYGKRRVKAFSGLIKGRRSWEYQRAYKMSLQLGVFNHYTIDDDFVCMSPAENGKLLRQAVKMTGIQSWFNGAAKLLYHPTFNNKESAARMRENNVFLPFIELEKKHTIDLYYQYNVEHLLGMTHSCTMVGDKHCGNCVCCFERVRGFVELGIQDPAPYHVSWSAAVEAMKRYKD